MVKAKYKSVCRYSIKHECVLVDKYVLFDFNKILINVNSFPCYIKQNRANMVTISRRFELTM